MDDKLKKESKSYKDLLKFKTTEFQQKIAEMDKKEKVTSSELREMRKLLEKKSAHIKSLEEKTKKEPKNAIHGSTDTERLQKQLHEATKREETLTEQLLSLKEEMNVRSQSQQVHEDKHRKEIRNYEHLVAENERRVRQKDIEMERLREKLKHNIEKDRDSQLKQKHTMAQLMQGNFSISGSKKVAGGCLIKSTSSDVIEALVLDRENLKSVNEELIHRVENLSSSLRDMHNESSVNSSASARNTSSAEISFDSELGGESGNRDNNNTERVVEQFKRIEYLNHRIELLGVECMDKEETIAGQRKRIAEMYEEMENLRLELDARPTCKQWAQNLRELKELEEKLHDTIMLRNESAEIESWRKHLNTRDRIKADRRNFELGLWLIDSLPKAVMKEALQTVCRELSVSDISDIKPALDKLKAVMTTVPRMERFISDVCSFVFQKAKRVTDEHNNVSQGDKPMIEEILPILKSWWEGLQQGVNLDNFRRAVNSELSRRESMLQTVFLNSGNKPTQDTDGNVFTITYGGGVWPESEKTGKICDVIRDMVDFQVDAMKQKNNFVSLQTFIRDNPDEMTNRILSHIQYMFGVQSLEGLIPKLNKIYIFTQELSTFTRSMRDVLGISTSPNVSDSSVLAEVEKVVYHSKRTNLTDKHA